MNITVANQGAYSEVFNITAYANTTVIDTVTDVALASGDCTTITFTWNTTTVAYGDYAIRVNATPVQSELDTLDNTYTYSTVMVTVPGDVNGDRIVDIFDIGITSANWGQSW